MKKLWHAFGELFLPSARNTYRPHLLRKSWLLFFLTIIITAEGVFGASYIVRQSKELQPAAVVPGEIVAFTNVERARESERLLIENALLDAAAQAKAEDMAGKGYFAHIGPDGKEPWAWIKEASYSYQYAGENLAVRFDESADVVSAWMASPTHRANIIKPVYTQIGVGVARGMYEGNLATFVVQYFGTPPGAPISAAVGLPAGEALSQEENTQVAGAQTSSAHVPTSSVSQNYAPPQVQSDHTSSFIRQAGEAITDSQQSTSWVIGSVLLLVLLLLALAFFIHIEIQSHEMLIGGALVAGVAVLFLLLNAHVEMPGTNTQQSASLGQIQYSVLIGPEATSTFATIFSGSEMQQTPPTVPSE